MFRTIFSIGLLQTGGIVITALRSKLFAVLLGPAGFGIVATIDQLVTSLAQLSNFSVPFTAMKFLSSSHSVGENEFKKSYAAFLRLMLGLALVATVASVAMVLWVLERIDPQLAQHRTTVVIAMLGMPALLLMMFFVNALAARQQSMRSVLLTVLYNAVLLIFGGIGCWLGGIRGIYLGAVPAAALLIGLAWLLLRARFKLPRHQRSAAIWSELKTHRQIGQTAFYTYVAVASIAGTMLLARYVSITQLSAEAAGLFQACLGIALSIGAVLGPANTLYLSPFVNRAIPAAEKTQAVGRFIPRLILLFCMGAVPVLLFPELVLQVLFSDRFTAAASLLIWFVLWQFVSQIASTCQHLLIGLDDMRGFCTALVAGNVVAAVGCVGRIGQFGLHGLGAAFVAGAIVSLSLTLLRLRWRHAASAPTGTFPLLIFAPLALVAVAMIPLGAEFEAAGICRRLLLAAGFAGALWLLLPKELRCELANGLRARMDRRRKTPE